MAGCIKLSKQQLKELGLETTYAVAALKGGEFVIVDTNLMRTAYSFLKKPRPLPLCYSRQPAVYATYEDAFRKIVVAVGAGPATGLELGE